MIPRQPSGSNADAHTSVAIVYSSMSQLEHLKRVSPFELQACCYIIPENPFEKGFSRPFPKLLWFYYQLRAYVFRQKNHNRKVFAGLFSKSDLGPFI